MGFELELIPQMICDSTKKHFISTQYNALLVEHGVGMEIDSMYKEAQGSR